MTVSLRAGILAGMLCSAAFPAFSQEAPASGVVDELFDDPVADAVVADTGIDHRTTYVTAEKVRLGGYFQTLGGVAAGYTSWPDPADLSAGLDKSVGASGKAVFSLDAMPGPTARIRAMATTYFTPFSGTFDWAEFSVDELYCDYTLAESVFFRLGQFTSVWGQGRLFAPGDLMADSEDGFSIRATVPTFLNGLSFHVLGAGTVADYTDLAYAAKADIVLAGTYLSGGVRYKEAEGLAALLSAKRVIAGTDVLADIVVRWDEASFSSTGIAGFFREWNDLKLYGEYMYSVDGAGIQDHKAGLAVGFNNILESPVDLGIKSRHSFTDGSGAVMVAATWVPWKYVTAVIGCPVVYGEPGTYYVVNSYVEDDDDGQASGLAGYRIGLIASLTLKVPF